jgi:serine/threonine-protein kinase
MVWIDRKGAIAVPALPSQEYRQPSLSFDGRRVALEVTGTNRDLWTYDLERGVMSPLTTTTEEEETPQWSPDGTRVAFASERDGQRGLFLIQSDRSGSEQRLWTTPDHFHVNAWSPNGQSIILNTRALATGQDLSVYSFESRTVTPFLTTPANEFGAAISRDGRWVAYVSDESGRQQVHVRPFGRPGGSMQISRDGGSEPAWAHSGRELFFRDVKANQLMTVDVGPGEALQVGPPRVLVKVPFVDADRDSGYLVSQDDKRFLGIRTDPMQEAREIQVTLNWFEELKRLLPP